MKTFLVIYTITNSLGSNLIFNMDVNATSIAAARDQIKVELGDSIVIINIIEL